MVEIRLGGRAIGADHPPFVIAEISGNHNGSLDRAEALIAAAARAGADAVKFQTYTADSLTLDCDQPEFILRGGAWDGWRLHALYQQAATPWSWFPTLFARAAELGLLAFSAPFDAAAVACLETLAPPAYKIASNELTDWPLIAAAAATGRPLLVSTGTATAEEIEETVTFCREQGVGDLAVLHCVSAYPARPDQANLRTMGDIARRCPDVVVGFSDHTLGTATAVAAVARGAAVIEKHLTLSRNGGGPDDHFSLEPAEFARLCQEVRAAWESLGRVHYGGARDLVAANIFTRQFWTVRDLMAGEVVDESAVRSIRGPANAGGIPPRCYRTLFGRRTARPVACHRPLRWADIASEEAGG